VWWFGHVRTVGSVGEDRGRTGGSAMFCLSPESGFVTEQWVGEESKTPELGVNAGYCG
jgi:hypothetical protein